MVKVVSLPLGDLSMSRLEIVVYGAISRLRRCLRVPSIGKDTVKPSLAKIGLGREGALEGDAATALGRIHEAPGENSPGTNAVLDDSTIDLIIRGLGGVHELAKKRRMAAEVDHGRRTGKGVALDGGVAAGLAHPVLLE